MAHIVIKDLKESVELDDAAMRAIIGGARTRAAQTQRHRGMFAKSSSSALMRNVTGAEKLGGRSSA